MPSAYAQNEQLQFIGLSIYRVELVPRSKNFKVKKLKRLIRKDIIFLQFSYSAGHAHTNFLHLKSRFQPLFNYKKFPK